MAQRTFTEKIRPAYISEIINASDARPATVTQVIKYVDSCKPATDGTLHMQTTYDYARDTKSGRVYGYPSLQTLPGWIRRLLCGDLYHDIDMANAHPNILLQIAEKHGFACLHLRDYVLRREELMLEIMVRHGLTRAHVKHLYIIATFGGDYREENATVDEHDDREFPPVTYSIKPIDDYRVELKNLADFLMGTVAYQPMKERLEKNRYKKNKTGTFLSWAACEVESRMLDCMVRFFAARGWTVGVLIFDGLQVEKRIGFAVTTQLLEECSAAIHREEGYRVSLMEKPMDVTGEDLLKLRPARVRPDPYSRLFPADRVTERVTHQRGILDEDLEFSPGVKVNVIIAGMGMGKSHAIDKFVTRHDADYPRIICVSARIQQASTMMALLRKFGFHHYQEFTLGDDNTGPAREDALHQLRVCDRVVIQYESMHLLFGRGMKVYDMLLVDEIRGVAAQFCSQMTNRDVYMAYSALTHLVEHCRHVLLLDADVEADGMVHEVVHHNFAGGDKTKYRVVRYTRVELNRSFRFTNNEKQWWKMLCDAVLNKKKYPKLMAIFRSKRQLAVFRKILDGGDFIEHRGNVMYFDGDSTAEHMQKFDDINGHLTKVRVLCFTSKVTVGADIQVEFSKVFVYGPSKQGPPVRDVYQMIGRARNITDKVIEVCMPKTEPKRNRTYESELRNIQTMKNDRQRMLNVFTDSKLVVMGDGQLEWSSSHFVRMLAWDSLEKSVNFFDEFIRAARRKRYPIVFDAEKPANRISLDDSKNIRKHSQKGVRIMEEYMKKSVLCEMRKQSHDEVDRTLEELQQKRVDLTPQEKQYVRYARKVYSAFFPYLLEEGLSEKTMDSRWNFETIDALAKNIDCYYNTYWMRAGMHKCTTDDVLRMARCNGGIVETIKARSVYINSVNEAVKLLGMGDVFEGLKDTQRGGVPEGEAVVDFSKLSDETKTQVGEYIEAASRAVNRPAKNKKMNARELKTSLAGVLKPLGYSLMSSQVRVGEREDDARTRVYFLSRNSGIDNMMKHFVFNPLLVPSVIEYKERGNVAKKRNTCEGRKGPAKKKKKAKIDDFF
jgi:hypothetical protein